MSARSIHPFPARMAPEIALSAIPVNDGTRLTVLDPMCGSGTVLNVALARGHRAIGVDIDPLAVMMSRVAVTAIDTSELLDAGERVVAHCKDAPGTPPWATDAETDAFVDYWFGSKQRRSLTALSWSVQAHSLGAIRLALQVAISRIIVTKSPMASLAADTSHSRPHRTLVASDYDVYLGFKKSLKQLARKLDQRPKLGEAEVTLGDARLLNGVQDASVDMAVTSPPYLNALDYLRGHKLALVWFGYKIADLRARRAESIGSERNLGSKASDAVAGMVRSVSAEAVDEGRLKRGMVERFAQDCVDFAGELDRVLKSDGSAVLVVGNSTLRGNYIRNDLIAQTALEFAGFVLQSRYERAIPPSRRYMAIDGRETSSITRRMRSEVVLTMAR